MSSVDAKCEQQELHAGIVVSNSVQVDRDAIDAGTVINKDADYDDFFKRLVDPELAPSEVIGTFVCSKQSPPMHDSERPIRRKIKTIGRSKSHVNSGSDQPGLEPLPPPAVHRRKRPREQTCAVKPTTDA